MYVFILPGKRRFILAEHNTRATIVTRELTRIHRYVNMYTINIIGRK